MQCHTINNYVALRIIITQHIQVVPSVMSSSMEPFWSRFLFNSCRTPSRKLLLCWPFVDRFSTPESERIEDAAYIADYHRVADYQRCPTFPNWLWLVSAVVTVNKTCAQLSASKHVGELATCNLWKILYPHQCFKIFQRTNSYYT